MRKKLLTFTPIFLWLVSFTAVWAQAPNAASIPSLRLSLSDCLRLAEENNGKLEASDYAIEGARWQYNEAKALFKPVLEVTDRMAPVPTDAQNAAESFFQGDITFFNSTKVGLGMPIHAFGKLATAKKLANQGIQAAQERKAKDRDEIAFQVKQLYYGILLGTELSRIMGDAVKKIDNHLAKEETDPEHSPYEIAKLRVFKLELEKGLREAEERSELGFAALRVQMGLPAAQSFRLISQYLEPAGTSLKSMENYLAAAQEARPEMGLIDIGIRAKELEWTLEKRKLAPNVGLGGFFEIGRTVDAVRNLSATDDFNNPFNYTRAGVGMEIKGQFDFHSARAKIKRLQSEYHKATTEASIAREGLLLEVKQAYQEAEQAKENLARAEERKKLARQMLFLSRSNIEIGVGEEQEYTDALQLVLSTRGEYFKAVFDYNIALAKLEWKAGGGR